MANKPNVESNDSFTAIITAGAIGGMLGPLFRIALELTTEEREITEISFGYFFGVFLLGVLGAGVAWGFREENRKKALVLGISIPALLQVTANDLPKKRKPEQIDATKVRQVKNKVGFDLNFIVISTAFAQTTGEAVDAPTKFETPKLKPLNRGIAIKVSGGEGIYADFLDGKNKVIQRVTLNELEAKTFDVPDAAQKIRLLPSKTRATSALIVLPYKERNVTAVDVRIVEEKEYGFFAAFGLDPEISTKMVIENKKPKYVYFGIRGDNKGWIEVNFLKNGSKEEPNYPNVGETFQANIDVAIRSDVIKYVRDKWMNVPAVGVLKKGQVVTVLEVITIPDNPNFVWLRIE